MASKTYGPLIGAHLVEDQLLLTLRTWMHDYLAVAERESGIEAGLTLRPRSYRKTISDAWELPEIQMPRVIVQSTGWADEPESDGQLLTMFWAVSVVVISKGQLTEDTLDRSRIFAAALLALLYQKGTDGVIANIDVTDVNFDVVPAQLEATHAGVEVVIVARVNDCLQVYGGPSTPSEPPPEVPEEPDGWPIVTETTVDLEIVEMVPDE